MTNTIKTNQNLKETFAAIANNDLDRMVAVYENEQVNQAVQAYQAKVHAISSQLAHVAELCTGLKQRYFGLKESTFTRASYMSAKASLKVCANVKRTIKNTQLFLVERRFEFGFEETKAMLKLFVPYLEGLKILIKGYVQMVQKYEFEQTQADLFYLQAKNVALT
ncbi:hypothetical protein [Lactococcus allomyrinae]|uniref:Uncharacterized protein n=1 Tax=Lactococcus allomyrinae TaxID=2419773 RepID=A0A387BBT4_9LACT|nr:hypothetical protein [Lactococcus allomyrinae]AYF99793.1 hypothetical protein D7I46_01060 [Lactococcus allomyrinae]